MTHLFSLLLPLLLLLLQLLLSPPPPPLMSLLLLCKEGRIQLHYINVKKKHAKSRFDENSLIFGVTNFARC